MPVREPTEDERKAIEQAKQAAPAGPPPFTYEPGEPAADGEPRRRPFTYDPRG